MSPNRGLEHPLLAAGTSLPTNRGDLLLTLYADRARVNRRGSIVFMMDLAFGCELDAVARRIATAHYVDGDL